MVILRSHEHEAAQCTLQKQVVLEGTCLTRKVTKPVVSLTKRHTTYGCKPANGVMCTVHDMRCATTGLCVKMLSAGWPLLR